MMIGRVKKRRDSYCQEDSEKDFTEEKMRLHEINVEKRYRTAKDSTIVARLTVVVPVIFYEKTKVAVDGHQNESISISQRIYAIAIEINQISLLLA